MSSTVVNMTVDFKLINQEQRGHGRDQLYWIDNFVVLLLAGWKCNFTSFKVVGPLKILKADFYEVITVHWFSNVRQKTEERLSYWDCFRYRLISVLKASIAIIQKLQNKTLSIDNFLKMCSKIYRKRNLKKVSNIRS